MTDIRKASAEAVEAAQQSDQFALILAALQAQQLVQQQAVRPPTPIVRESSAAVAGKWLAIGVGGSMLMVTVAFAAVALAIAAACTALVTVVVWAIWRDVRRGTGKG
jgi:hypothetical protein